MPGEDRKVSIDWRAIIGNMPIRLNVIPQPPEDGGRTNLLFPGGTLAILTGDYGSPSLTCGSCAAELADVTIRSEMANNNLDGKIAAGVGGVGGGAAGASDGGIGVAVAGTAFGIPVVGVAIGEAILGGWLAQTEPSS